MELGLRLGLGLVSLLVRVCVLRGVKFREFDGKPLFCTCMIHHCGPWQMNWI